MKTFRLISSIAALLALAGCAKEAFEASSPEGSTRICVGMPEMKTALGELSGGKRPIFWESGDKINANDLTSKSLSVEGTASSAEFVFDGIVSYPANLLYPSSYYKDAMTITVPSTLTLKPVVPMAAEMASGTASASMKALTALVYVPLKLAASDPDTDKILQVRLSTEATQLCGDFTVDYAAGTLTAAGTEPGLNTQRVTVNSALSAEPLDIFIPVPAGEYTLTLKFVDASGHCMTKTLTKAFAAGKVYSTPATEFVPTETAVDVNITSSDDWNTFAEAFNANPESYSNVIVSIDDDLSFLGTENIPLGVYDSSNENYVYFNGTILGNDHIITDLMSSVSLVGAMKNGSISNLTFDESCQFDVPVDTSNVCFGPFAGSVSGGSITNCTNKANITFSFDNSKGDSRAVIYAGGIAGRLYPCDIENCVNNGTITFGPGYILGKGSKFYCGGIAGYVYKATSSIKNSENNGSILIPSDYVATYTYLGGIAGHTVGGEYIGCVNNGIIRSDYSTRTSDDQYQRIGGIIAGCNTNDLTIKNCANTADLIDNGAGKQHYLGGIAAYLTNGANALEGNRNSGSLQSLNKTRYPRIAQLCAFMKVSKDATFSLPEIKVATGDFTGSIHVEQSEHGITASSCYLGTLFGIIEANEDMAAAATCRIKITGNNTDISPKITLDMYNTDESKVLNLNYAYAGGLVGKSEVPIDIKGFNMVQNSDNTAEIRLDYLAKTPKTAPANKVGAAHMGLGGVIGCALLGANISDCNVYVPVYLFKNKSESKASDGQQNIGGVVGALGGIYSSTYYCGDSEVRNCSVDVSASISDNRAIHSGGYVNGYSAKSYYCGGGVVGSFGRSANAVTSTITISNCVCNSNVYMTRGGAGNIIGYVINGTIENCSATGTNYSLYGGGIAGWAINTSITNCSYVNKEETSITCRATGSSSALAGGIVGNASKTSITGCGSFCNIIHSWSAASIKCQSGALAGKVDAECSITSSKCGGKVQWSSTGTNAEPAQTIELSASNVTDYAVCYDFKDVISTSGASYWNGE